MQSLEDGLPLDYGGSTLDSALEMGLAAFVQTLPTNIFWFSTGVFPTSLGY